jgi:hypothetical protein
VRRPRPSEALAAGITAAMVLALGSAASPAEPLLGAAPLSVSANRRFLVTADGQPFFYLGDTAWELFHRLNRAEATDYLKTRAAQGFTVIQAVALAETDGLTAVNAYGDVPLRDGDPAHPDVTPGSHPDRPAEYDYWDHVDFIVNEAARRGLRVAMLPAWGRWVTDRQSNGKPAFTAANARSYGSFLGRRYRNKPIIWVLGGDRNADGVEDVWRAMARGIAEGVNGREDYTGVTMTFHPSGGRSSSQWFHNDRWLTFNMWQTGHGRAEDTRSWESIASDYARSPVKPVLDGEPLYEDHPIAFDAPKNGYSVDANVRQRAYWDTFAGAAGHTYGNHAVWQMYATGRAPINGPLYFWREAVHRPGAEQMRHLRALLESRPYLSRVPDQSLVTDSLQGSAHIQATRGDGYAFIYSGEGRAFTVNLGKTAGKTLTGYWYSPRDGAAFPIGGKIENRGTRAFTPPSTGFGSDWVLVLDDAARKFPPPGTAGEKATAHPAR